VTREPNDYLIAAILEELRLLHAPIPVMDKAALLQDVENELELSRDD